MDPPAEGGVAVGGTPDAVGWLDSTLGILFSMEGDAVLVVLGPLARARWKSEAEAEWAWVMATDALRALPSPLGPWAPIPGCP